MKTNSVERSCFDCQSGGFIGRDGPYHERVVHDLQSLTIQEAGGGDGGITNRGTSGAGGPRKEGMMSGSVTTPNRTGRTRANKSGKESQKNVVKVTLPRITKEWQTWKRILTVMKTPHQYPEPVPIEWNIGLGLEENMAHIAKSNGDNASAESMIISHDKEGIQGHAILGPGQKKRKASVHYIPIDEKGQPIPEALVRNKESDRIFAPDSSPAFVVGKNDKEAREGGGRLKINSSSSALQMWHKKSFGDNEANLKLLENRLAWIQSQDDFENKEKSSILFSKRCSSSKRSEIEGILQMKGYVIFLFGQTVGRQIVAIDIAGGLGKDFVVWKRSPKGTFTVKEAYWQENEHKFGCIHESWKMIWSKELHPRASLFLWRMCSGALPTRDKIGSGENLNCIFCNDNIESPNHVFFECHLAKTLWFGAPLPVRIDLIQGEDVKTRIMNLCSNFKRDDRVRILLCGYVVWDTIWHYRNSILHGGRSRDIPCLMAEVLSRFSELVAADEPDPMMPPRLVQQVPSGAPFNSKVLFSDGSFKDGCCGMAVIGLDKNNMEWYSVCSSTKGLSALDAELKAIALALQWADHDGGPCSQKPPPHHSLYSLSLSIVHAPTTEGKEHRQSFSSSNGSGSHLWLPFWSWMDEDNPPALGRAKHRERKKERNRMVVWGLPWMDGDNQVGVFGSWGLFNGDLASILVMDGFWGGRMGGCAIMNRGREVRY
ncbi:hypothetical protein F8388_013718 [Cannabis sativa]|uniref:Reverse transcriptase zinc-binding domain-containing protein n=1 Tax=Cannabis sativa TaxID=3483 RepID=A0A7J6HVA7_CANSA|nr:hypothetical protein F8388_013718 [Cannabis sativa]KAF4398320.1 hypothetical protein G4B88_007599 [Cannabis sativa]